MIKEFFAGSVEEALQKAEDKLGVKKEALEYEVLDQKFGCATDGQKTAILVKTEGIQQGDEISGGEGEPTDEEKSAREEGAGKWTKVFCEGVLKRMGFGASVDLKPGGENTILEIEMPEQGPDLRKGMSRELRGALQHLVNRVAVKGADSGQHYLLDIGGTLIARTEKMKNLAKYLSGKVNELSENINIHLMDSQDRRLLHVAMVDDKNVETQGYGDKQYRVLSVGNMRRKKKKRSKKADEEPRADKT